MALRLGGYPAHSIAVAREWAGKLNSAFERGVDPREEMGVEKAEFMSSVASNYSELNPLPLSTAASRPRGGGRKVIARTPELKCMARGERAPCVIIPEIDQRRTA